jgi:thiol-disulfide isomerase/thioredoxin
MIMKKYVKGMLFSLVMLGAFVQNVKAQGIEFSHDLSESLKKAKAENKLVFVDFYTSWCGPCKVMTAEVFPLPNVGTYFNSNFISCKVQCDDKGIGVELGNKYKIIAYPTLMFLNGDGELVHSFVGSTSGNGLIEAAKVALNPDKNLMSAIKKWDSGDRSKEFVASYFSKLKRVYQYEKANNDFNTYFNKLSANDKADKSTFELIKTIGVSPFSPIFEYIEKNRDAFAKSTGAKEVDEYVANAYLWHIRRLIGKSPRLEFKTAMTKFKAKKYPYYDEYAQFYNLFEIVADKEIVTKEYLTLGTEFLEKYGKKNDSYVISLASIYQGGAGEGGIKWMEDLLARNRNPQYLDTYFYILWRNNFIEKALVVANEMRNNAIKNRTSTKSIDDKIEMVKGIKVRAK